MQAVYEQERSNGFVVLAVNSRESADQVASFMRDQQLSFPALLDSDGAVGTTYRATALPSSFFIDRNGIVRAVYYGPMPRSVIAGTVTQLLAEVPTSDEN
jgi:cytochrome c biogenesis protein CcmG/thiol:disulfide interchange protein DsbE